MREYYSLSAAPKSDTDYRALQRLMGALLWLEKPKETTSDPELRLKKVEEKKSK